MPKYAFLETPLLCPQCQTQITDLLWFQWGYCRGRDPQPEDRYHIGDSIIWKVCTDGSTPAWTYFLDDPVQSANIGDPTVHNILVQEAIQFFWNPAIEAVHYDTQTPPPEMDPQKIYYGGQYPPNQPRTCPNCQVVLAGALIEIRNNIIVKAWIYELGEFDPGIDRYILGEDDSIIPMRAWNDSPMTNRDTC